MCNTLLNLAQSPAITNMLVARICLYVRQKKKQPWYGQYCDWTLRFWHLYNLVCSCISFLEPVKNGPSDYIRGSFSSSHHWFIHSFFTFLSVICIPQCCCLINSTSANSSELYRAVGGNTTKANHWHQTYRWSMFLIPCDQLSFTSLLPSQSCFCHIFIYFNAVRLIEVDGDTLHGSLKREFSGYF